jgi:hypothetical protein
MLFSATGRTKEDETGGIQHFRSSFGSLSLSLSFSLSFPELEACKKKQSLVSFTEKECAVRAGSDLCRRLVSFVLFMWFAAVALA